MKNIQIHSRVKLLKASLEIPYIKKRKSYTNMYAGKTGTVLGFTVIGDKVAIQFDDIVFTDSSTRVSSHNNGCHGRGELDYCWYTPIDCVELIDEFNFNEEKDNLLLL